MIEISSTDAENIIGLKHKYQFTGDKTAPLAVLIHGRAGNYDVMWTFKRCIPESYNIISFQAPEHDPIGGYSWWQVAGGEKILDSLPAADKLIASIHSAIKHYKLSPKFLIALGFSQGAVILSVILQKSPEIFSSVGLLAGLVVEIEENSVRNSKSLPQIFFAHGINDEVIPVAKAKKGQSYLKKLGFNTTLVEDSVGHKVGTEGMRELKEFLINSTC